MVAMIFFLVYLFANFVWLLLVVGGLMTWMMPRNKNRNRIIISVSGVLSLLLTLAVIERGPDHDDGRDGCNPSRGGSSCN